MPRPGDTLPPAPAPVDSGGRDGQPRPELTELIGRLPTSPGCYLMKDRRGKIFYVGKAIDLRARVRSYFSRGDGRAFVPLLGRILADVETIVTANEKEALLLENNLIKQHQPRFNVNLRDDKSYLVLRLDPRQRYPRLEVVRRLGDDGARYFGPFHSATGCRETLRVVNRHFQLRTCSDQDMASRTRPCLQHQIKRCPAPCVLPVPPEEYAAQVDDVTLFLQGKDRQLVARLRERMLGASEALEFERAAQVRDQLAAVEKTLTDQRVVSATFVDQDVFGLFREGERVEIAVLHVRQGKLLGRRSFSFGEQTFPDEEVLSSFLGLYYDQAGFVPDAVLLPFELPDAAAHEEALRERAGAQAGRKVEVLCPRRGTRRKLVDLSLQNAKATYQSRSRRDDDALAALEKLQRRLRLKRLPRRIECFDISHLMGSLTVASMVVFQDGEPDKASYRKFKVQTVTNDDFAAMYEVITRRFKRARESSQGWAPPDLLVIDGGKGQLGATMAALADLGVEIASEKGFDVIALAKERTSFARPLPRSKAERTERARARKRAAAEAAAGVNAAAGTAPADEPAMAAELEIAQGLGAGAEDGIAAAEEGARKARPTARATEDIPDRVFLPRIKDPIRLQSNTAELFLLARVRDEAHRFAITYHRKLRHRRTLRSALTEIPQIGAQRAKQLLRHFGSARAVRAATLAELAAAPGMTGAAAEAVHRFFHEPTPAPLR